MPARAKSPIRMEGLTLTVKDVKRSVAFYGKTLGLTVEFDHGPDFALIRVADGGTIGLLSARFAGARGMGTATRAQRSGVHVELSTDDLDALYRHLKARGVRFHEPPHEDEWERAMSAYDPDGYTVEIAEGRRGERYRAKPQARPRARVGA
jgi:catechol 2,3-dioxygenase-like lactoylglutathione lyase family enzyme